MMLDTNAIYVLWLREIKRYLRSKARIIGTIMMPMFFLLGLGFGLNTLIKIPNTTNYIQYLVPGIMGMTLLFTGTTSGFQVIWDRQFGFLKEIMVTPNSRLSIALGRAAGGATTAIIPSMLVLVISLLIGFQADISILLILALAFVILIGTVFICLGLIVATFLDDPQAFGVIVNFITFPLLFLSGAIFPLDGLPSAVQFITYINPLTYGVDGLRYSLLGVSTFPVYIDFAALVAYSAIMLGLTTYAFTKAEVT